MMPKIIHLTPPRGKASECALSAAKDLPRRSVYWQARAVTGWADYVSHLHVPRGDYVLSMYLGGLEGEWGDGRVG